MTSHPVFIIFLMGSFLVSCRSTYKTSSAKESFSAEDTFILDALPPELRQTKWSLLPKDGAIKLDGFDSAYYWPMSRGGLTAKLFGESLSPLEKFERIFGQDLDVVDIDPDAADRKKSGGITKAYLQSISGERGLPWAGHCEGSALAVQWFKPIHPVNYTSDDGTLITFYPHEIRGLIAYWLKGYTASEGDFKVSGKRVDPGTTSATENGRPVDKSIRDVNPGLFVIALGNFIGSAGRTLIADISPTDEVLNFPIVGYRFHTIKTMSKDQAKQMTRFNGQATQFIETRIDVTLIDNHRVIVPTDQTSKTFSKTYAAVLELDSNGMIIGGEWMGSSQIDHPDFIYSDGRNENSMNEATGNGFSIAAAMRKLIHDSQNGSTDENQRLRIEKFKTHPDIDIGYQAFEDHPIVPKR